MSATPCLQMPSLVGDGHDCHPIRSPTKEHASLLPCIATSPLTLPRDVAHLIDHARDYGTASSSRFFPGCECE
eukprot:3586257-Pyramimonas_sp.AAC.1